jgi:hypothetical protein
MKKVLQYHEITQTWVLAVRIRSPKRNAGLIGPHLTVNFVAISALQLYLLGGGGPSLNKKATK